MSVLVAQAIHFNPNYALEMPSLPKGLTKTLETNVLSGFNF